MSDTGSPAAAPTGFAVAPSPHIAEPGLTTRQVMIDVLLALLPLVAAAVVVFGLAALWQIAICVSTCLAAEAVFTLLRGRRPTLGDGSAVITGLILALSLPATAPFYAGLIASVVGIGVGKVAFGGLGQNIFNPAMVGRAFVLLCFAQALGASGYVDAGATGVLTQATPLTEPAGAGWLDLLIGYHNGSLGETSVVAVLLGGIYLCLCRVASWEIPVSMIVTMTLLALGSQGLAIWNPSLTGVAGFELTVQHHLLGGAFMFGAFFIATDPVTSPLTRTGKVIFGIGLAFLIWALRVFSTYPEGVMFAVLIMNACVPLLNRWTVPTPLGGPLPRPKEAKS